MIHFILITTVKSLENSHVDLLLCALDINECDGNPCESNEKCINTFGSYRCSRCINGTNYENGICVGKHSKLC